MSPRFRRTTPDPAAARLASLFIASLYFLGAVLVVYFRVDPFRRVVDRAAEARVAVPSWIPWAANAGTVLVAGYLAWRGRVRLRTGANPPTDSI